MVTTIGIISIKGGVGKTTTVANLGSIFSHDFNKRVLIVDGNLSAPNLGIHLGVIDPKITLTDVLSNKAGVYESIYEYAESFHIMPSSIRTRKFDIDPFKLKHKLKPLKDDYDIIIIDSSPNLNNEILSTMIASDMLIAVTTPDYPTLSTTLRAIKLAKEHKTPIIGLIVNRTLGKRFELSLEEIENASEVPVLAILPDDLKIQEAIASTTPASLHTPLGNAVIEYRKLGAALLGEEYEDPRLLSRIKNYFSTLSKNIPKDKVNRSMMGKRIV